MFLYPAFDGINQHIATNYGRPYAISGLAHLRPSFGIKRDQFQHLLSKRCTTCWRGQARTKLGNHLVAFAITRRKQRFSGGSCSRAVPRET